MSTPEKFSTTNILNSIATDLVAKMLANNYIVYWKERYAVETNDGWYFEYSTKFTTYLADGTFAAAVASSKAMVSITQSFPASPQILQRHITEARSLSQNEIVVPALSIEIGPALGFENVELGTNLQRRHRHLVVAGFLRDDLEMGAIADFLAIWYDNNTNFPVYDHDSGTATEIGQMQTVATVVDSFRDDENAQEQTAYQVICNTMLEYVV